MDFNLSQICGMLGDRLEEYKTSSKKRKVERGSVAPKAKNAKLSDQTNPENSTKRNCIHMYTSTPLQTPKSGSKQLSMLPAMFSAVIKSPSLETTRLRMRKRDINVRKLTFDDTEDSSDSEMGVTADVTSKSTTKSCTSPNLFYVKKAPSKRLLKRSSTNNIRKLTFDDDECDDKVENFTKDSDEVMLNQVRISPVDTPKRCNLQTITSNVSFDISYEDMVENLSNSCEDVDRGDLSLSKSNHRRSKLKTRILTFDDSVNEDYKEDVSNVDLTETTLTQDFPQTSVMVLNMGIFIRPL